MHRVCERGARGCCDEDDLTPSLLRRLTDINAVRAVRAVRGDDDGIYNKRVGRGRRKGPLMGMLDEQAHVFCTSVLLAHTSDKLHLGGRAGDGGSKPGLRG